MLHSLRHPGANPPHGRPSTHPCLPFRIRRSHKSSPRRLIAAGGYFRTNLATTSARFVVDATGRKAQFARMQGARLHFLDRLTSYTRVFARSDVSTAQTLIGASAHGWWYTAPLPGEQARGELYDRRVCRARCGATID